MTGDDQGTVSGIGALRGRFRRSSLTVKLTVWGALVTAAVVLAAFWAIGVQTRTSARLFFASELGRHQGTLLQLQKEKLDQLISSTAIITQSPTLRSALATFRVESNFGGAPRRDLVQTVERELAKLVARVGRDLVVATNESGRVFASAIRDGLAPAYGDDLSAMPAVRRAIAPTALPDSGELAVYRSRDATYQVAVYPLVLDGYVIGALLLGERLDRGLVASASAAFDGDVIVTSGRAVLAGTARGDRDELVEELARAQRTGDAAPTIRLGGDELVTAALALGQTQTGEPVSLWLLQPLGPTVRTLTGPLLRDVALYGLLAVILSAVGAGMAARSVLKPFREFIGYLQSGAAAERHERRPVSRDAPAEIKHLSESFDQLMESIAAKQAQLTQRTTELTATDVVLIDEVRERERVEHELRERDEQLRQSQKLEAVGTLAGGIAHDFNNLLTAVSGFTQLALMSSDPESSVAADLKQVVEAADRAGHLTKQLLAFSRKQVLRPTVLDVGAVISGVAPLFGRLLGEHIRLQLEIAADVPRVLADRGQLEQVIMNLAINARDAMPRGGVLTISAAATGGAGAESSQVGIAVADTGSGIPESIRGRIFEPFFTTKEPGKGTGLGLSTVYGIVTQSGGKIDVESEIGTGTTFRITWPAASEAGFVSTFEESIVEMPRGSETILLVEDDPSVRLLARRTLEERGYTVLPAADPVEALRLAATAHIDVILSDMVMPKMSGPQLVEGYLAKYPAPVVIFMSGYADEGLMSDSRSIRSAFLRKPFTPMALACLVRDAIDASKRTPLAPGIS